MYVSVCSSVTGRGFCRRAISWKRKFCHRSTDGLMSWAKDAQKYIVPLGSWNSRGTCRDGSSWRILLKCINSGRSRLLLPWKNETSELRTGGVRPAEYHKSNKTSRSSAALRNKIQIMKEAAPLCRALIEAKLAETLEYATRLLMNRLSLKTQSYSTGLLVGASSIAVNIDKRDFGYQSRSQLNL